MYVGVGANFNDDNGTLSGHTRVFTARAPIYLVDSINTCMASYTWVDGQTYVTSTEACSAPHYTVGTNSRGCDTIRVLILNLDPAYLPNTTIVATGNRLSVATAMGATYQWLDCNTNNSPITGATNANFTPGQNGQYAVVVSENGCIDTSACYNFTRNSISTLANGQTAIKLYPNPTTQNFTISLGAAQDQVQIQLLDLTGRVIRTQTYEYLQQAEWSLDATMPTGVYLVRVQVGQSSSTVKTS